MSNESNESNGSELFGRYEDEWDRQQTQRQERRKAIQEVQLSYRITEPTRSWDIAEWVIARIKEEPRRLWMGTWGCVTEDGESDPSNPPCGTAACFAGWSNIRVHGKFWETGSDIATMLAGWNGLESDTEGHDLRAALYHNLFVADDLISLPGGSIESVMAVEGRAREIMTEHEARLKSVMVHPDGHFTRV